MNMRLVGGGGDAETPRPNRIPRGGVIPLEKRSKNALKRSQRVSEKRNSNNHGGHKRSGGISHRAGPGSSSYRVSEFALHQDRQNEITEKENQCTDTSSSGLSDSDVASPNSANVLTPRKSPQLPRALSRQLSQLSARTGGTNCSSTPSKPKCSPAESLQRSFQVKNKKLTTSQSAPATEFIELLRTVSGSSAIESIQEECFVPCYASRGIPETPEARAKSVPVEVPQQETAGGIEGLDLQSGPTPLRQRSTASDEIEQFIAFHSIEEDIDECDREMQIIQERKQSFERKVQEVSKMFPEAKVERIQKILKLFPDVDVRDIRKRGDGTFYHPDVDMSRVRKRKDGTFYVADPNQSDDAQVELVTLVERPEAPFVDLQQSYFLCFLET